MNEKKESKWNELQKAEEFVDKMEKSSSSIFSIPDEIKLKHSSGLLFGLVMGIGFCIGFIISLLILLGIVSFYVYSKFPQLFA